MQCMLHYCFISIICYQVSVDILLGLQIGHALRHILTHLQELDGGGVLLQPLPEVRQQTAIGEELGHNVNGPLFGADTIQLNQVLMTQLPGLSERRRELKQQLNIT